MEKSKTNTTRKKKWAAVLLSLVMAIAFMPAMTFADDTPDGDVAKIGETTYKTLPDAVAAAKDGDTITLLKDAAGNGVIIYAKDAKTLTFDFDGHTYTMNGTPVGSTGTENQAMHFEKGGNITLKNGTLKVAAANAEFGIQNYSDLTLRDFTIDAADNDKCTDALSLNNGDVQILGNSSIKAAKGQDAFDVCVMTHYPDGVRVTVDTTGDIDGLVEYDSWDGVPAENKTALTIKNGVFKGEFTVEGGLEEAAKEKINIYGGTFSGNVPMEYLAEGCGLTMNSDGTYGVRNIQQQDNELIDLQKELENLKAKYKKPAAVSGLKLKAGKKKFTASWKKADLAKSYQLQYSTSKKFSKKATKTTSKTKLTVTKRKAKKTYYVRVRGYKTVDGDKICGKWSKAAKIKTK
jgi:hypothetical protein